MLNLWERILPYLNEKAVSRLTIGVAAGIICGVADALILSAMFNKGGILGQIFSPTPHEIWQRGLVFILNVGFATHFHIVMTKRERAERALSASEEKYRTLVEGANQSIFIADQEGVFQFLNASAARYLGGRPQEFIGKRIEELFPPHAASAQLADIKELFATGRPLVREVPTSFNERRYWFETNLQPLRGSSGEIEAVIGIATDITERKWAEEEYRRRNRELATLNAIAATVSQSLDLKQVLNDALDEVQRLQVLGRDAKSMIFLLEEESNTLWPAAQRGASPDHPCLTDPPRVGECLCGLAVQQGEAVISADCHDDARHSRSWKDMVPHRDVCLPLKVRSRLLGVMNFRLPQDGKGVDDSEVQLLTAIADQIGVAIENAQLFEAVKRHRERLRILSARVAEIEENERRRLARELHDQVGQNLTALGIDLNIIRAQLPEGINNKLGARLDDAMGLLEQTTGQIRDVMSVLRPPILDDYGLVATLNWYGRQFESRTGISVVVQGDEPHPRLDTQVEIALFRITQEALNNIAKHAQANEATVSVEEDRDTVRLIIADDGIGFDATQLQEPEGEHGWGHLIMSERAEAVGGRCWIESHPQEGGTRVIVEVER